MKAAVFDYRSAADLADAVQRLAEGDGRAKLMSGSQSFGPMLNLRLARPQTVIDISRLPALAGVREAGGSIVIGAGVTHAAIEDGVHAPLREHPLRAVAAGIAYRAIRNRGTVGGSLAHADPAADWMVTLTALGAALQLRSPRGERELALAAFMHAAYTTDLADDEVIVSVRVPAARGGRWGYYKFCRKPGEFAEASAAVWQAAPGAPLTIVLGALDGAPQALPALAEAIARDGAAAATRERIAAAVAAALPERQPLDCQLHAACVARALAQAGWTAPVAVAGAEAAE
ncbi:MAG: FAD binding domain-containing protein [Proteobacteria bacterium]|nr:FAD binding domain-containing protein [Pseudomonadota bacterium]